MNGLRWPELVELWTSSWFFRVNLTLAIVGLVYWATHPVPQKTMEMPAMPNYTFPYPGQ